MANVIINPLPTQDGCESLENMEIDENVPDVSNKCDGKYTDENSTVMNIDSTCQVKFKQKTSFHIQSPSQPILEAAVYQLTWRPESSSQCDTPEKQQNNDTDFPFQIRDCNALITSFMTGSSLFKANGLDPGSGDYGRPPPSSPKLMFKDCGGLDKQIKFIQTAILCPLRGENLGQYDRFGLEPPKGILFYGVPGTGKTRLAQALSNEISTIIGRQVNFIYRKGNDVASKWFGQSSENLRQVFDEAKQQKPSVLFFDELDGLCPSRDKPYISEAYVTIVTTMLGLMDELHRGEVFVIGATNRMDGIDPALRRPGRFDKYLEFLPPTQQGREEILAIHTNNWKSKPSAEVLTKLSQQTSGFSGADLAKLCLDAFDRALNREIAQEKLRKHVFTYTNVNLDNLTVAEEDWQLALEKMKPSTAGVFGSAQYFPQNTPSAYIQPLLHETLNNISTHIVSVLSQRGCSTGVVPALYIWSECESCLSTLDDFIISPLFGVRGGEEMASYSKYSLSPETLYTTLPRNWPMKVNETFSQAIASHVPSILYIPDVEELYLAIKNHRLSEAINLKYHLERLRDTNVLLLVTGSYPPEEFSWDNPFNHVITSETRAIEIQRASYEERDAFFAGIKIPEQFYMNWSVQNGDLTEALTTLRHLLVSITEDHEYGSIVTLFDYVQQELNSLGNDPSKSTEDILRSAFEIATMYKINHTLIDTENLNAQGQHRTSGDDGK